DDVAELERIGDGAAAADADERANAVVGDQLVGVDRAGGHAHASALHRHLDALVRAGVAEHVPYGGVAAGILEVRLGNPLRAERVTGKEYPLGNVTRLGANVRAHAAHPAIALLVVCGASSAAGIGYPSRRWRVRVA